jgi:hypothetical protein
MTLSVCWIVFVHDWPRQNICDIQANKFILLFLTHAIDTPTPDLGGQESSMDLMKNPIEKMANVGQSHLLHNVLDVFCDHIAWMGEYPSMMTYCAQSPLSCCWPSYDRKGAPVCSMHLLSWSHLYLTHNPLGGILGSRLNVFMDKK